jgi:hypothetical protein
MGAGAVSHATLSNMHRWQVHLKGEHIDLEDFVRSFPSGDIMVSVAGDGHTYLSATELDAFDNAGDVHRAATALVERLFAVLLVQWLSLRKPTLGSIQERDPAGILRTHHVLVAEAIQVRTKVYAPLVTVAGESVHAAAGPTAGQTMFAASRSSAPLQRAVARWGASDRSWGDLYTILEDVEQHLGSSVSVAGFCSKRKRSVFTQSANTSAAGLKSRHGGKTTPPTDPMTHAEALAFIADILGKVLRHP